MFLQQLPYYLDKDGIKGYERKIVIVAISPANSPFFCFFGLILNAFSENLLGHALCYYEDSMGATVSVAQVLQESCKATIYQV